MSARTHCRRRYHDQGYPSPTPTPAPNQAALAVLEERRVALPPPPPLERNFHVFYMLATREAGSLLTAGRGVQRFRCALLVLTSPAPAPPPVCVCVCVCAVQLDFGETEAHAAFLVEVSSASRCLRVSKCYAPQVTSPASMVVLCFAAAPPDCRRPRPISVVSGWTTIVSYYHINIVPYYWYSYSLVDTGAGDVSTIQ